MPLLVNSAINCRISPRGRRFCAATRCSGFMPPLQHRRRFFDRWDGQTLPFASPHMKGAQPYWPGTLWRYYAKPALKRARITKHVSYHTFRHTFGTLLNASGENPKVVQELLRHASLKVTTDVYMQAVGPQKREAQSNLVRLVRKGLDSEAKSS